MAASGRKRKKQKPRDSRAALLIMILVVALLAGAVQFRSNRLRQKLDTVEAQRIELQEQIDAEAAENASLLEKKIYVKTDEYIEKIAKEKLSLVFPDEILFRSNNR